MLRATFDVNGYVIGVALARNTLEGNNIGQVAYRAAYVLFDKDLAWVGQVWHDPLNGAGDLISLCSSLVYKTDPKPFVEEGVQEWINSPYNEDDQI
jgi:hypothetical protein